MLTRASPLLRLQHAWCASREPPQLLRGSQCARQPLRRLRCTLARHDEPCDARARREVERQARAWATSFQRADCELTRGLNSIACMHEFCRTLTNRHACMNFDEQRRIRMSFPNLKNQRGLCHLCRALCSVLGVGVTVPIDSRQIGSGFKKKL